MPRAGTPSGASIAGRVTWPDGAPANGVTVRVRFDMSQMAGMGAMNALQGGSGRARTDDQGAFTVTHANNGQTDRTFDFHAFG